eukprot:CAMPEP_0180265114 /NCGR_PEP_ID=MMETSP0988-20121125/250_1 /TAXON_ID=697907 /ORGANISM="non described non described, Strain CCMP2293" /LENGTH=102 /DNA_ID=CAMNT_0022235519 /DNA_START=182 /DNA_END=490 /DNA_ORIENTATION=+
MVKSDDDGRSGGGDEEVPDALRVVPEALLLNQERLTLLCFLLFLPLHLGPERGLAICHVPSFRIQAVDRPEDNPVRVTRPDARAALPEAEGSEQGLRHRAQV